MATEKEVTKEWNAALVLLVIVVALFLIWGLFAAQYLLLLLGVLGLILIPKVKMHTQGK